MTQLKLYAADNFEFESHDRAIDSETISIARGIVDRVRSSGESAIREYAEQFGERESGDLLLIEKSELNAAFDRLPEDQQTLLKRVAARIERFAQAQRETIQPLEMEVPGGKAGHTIEPVERAGCYAPAGRFPLPSTVLMTAITARVAGCETVVVATPNPGDLMLGAAHAAGADQVLAIGGAHAVAALAYGFDNFRPVDLIAGPGSRWVTAAKQLVNGDVGIDMLAGPSELVVIADESADPDRLACDLLAQAEHDTDARVFLVTDSEELVQAVNERLTDHLAQLPTAANAKVAVAGGAAILCDSIDDGSSFCAVAVANRLAPEHLELHLKNASDIAAKIRNAGCIFIGHESAEVFGDYGVGPNHTLPTAGTARWSAGLNVFTFLRIRTWIRLEQAPQDLIDDTAALAELEGLIGHQRAGLHRAK